MKTPNLKTRTGLWTLLAITTVFARSDVAQAKVNAISVTQRTAEQQVKHLLDPLLDKYCHDDCRLMSVAATVDLATQDSVAPGFDDMESQATQDLAPSSARAKILMSDRVGPNSKGKLLELLQTFLDTLDYPVTLDVQTAHFPQPTGQESKVGELRDRITKEFKSTLDGLLAQFCPQQCLLADYTLKTDVVNGEEAQYGSSGDYVQDGDTAVKVREITATILMDDTLSGEERSNILEMAKLKTTQFKNASITGKSMRFPRPGVLDGEGNILAGTSGARGGRGLASSNRSEKSATEIQQATKTENTTNSQQQSTANSTANNNVTSDAKSTSKENNTRQEHFERFEKIERVESGDAVQAELGKFKVYGLVFACSILSLLIFIALSTMRPRKEGSGAGGVTRIIQSLAADPAGGAAPAPVHEPRPERSGQLSKRYEIESLMEDLSSVFAQQPRVAKQVFSRILTEEGVETTAQYMHFFGESVVIDLLRDPSLQTDVNELLEFFAKTPQEISDDDKLELLRKLHNRTVAGKLVVLGNRSSNLFDFLAEMDGLQILELVRTESLTVKAIVMTQCDAQKRAQIYAQLDADVRMKLLGELSRIDYLPRDYIFNVANALKRKRRENPRLNTEALPGSEVLVSLLERTGQEMQRTVVKGLEAANPESARTVKGKLVSIETLKYLRDGQLLEVVLSLKHDELLQFLKGTAPEIKRVIFSKSPKELVLELEDELAQVSVLSREGYNAVERKVLNRMKVMANEGLINLIETNERMFGNGGDGSIPSDPNAVGTEAATQGAGASGTIKKVVGW